MSALVWLPEIVPSSVQVAPPSVERNEWMRSWVTLLLIPIVVDQATPFEDQSTVGSELNASPGDSGRVVCL